MRSKFGTALALAAVLLTGTAAAAINTQALNSPTGSTLGTAATTLLPADPVISAALAQAPVTAVAPNQTQSAGTSAPDQSASPAATVAIPAANQPATSMASAPNSPTVVYGNPNPSKGDDDDDDDDDEDDDDDDDEDEDDD